MAHIHSSQSPCPPRCVHTVGSQYQADLLAFAFHKHAGCIVQYNWESTRSRVHTVTCCNQKATSFLFGGLKSDM
jgi:hypothetical protein